MNTVAKRLLNCQMVHKTFAEACGSPVQFVCTAFMAMPTP